MVSEKEGVLAQTITVSYIFQGGTEWRKKEADILVLERTKALDFSLFNNILINFKNKYFSLIVHNPTYGHFERTGGKGLAQLSAS